MKPAKKASKIILPKYSSQTTFLFSYSGKLWQKLTVYGKESKERALLKPVHAKWGEAAVIVKKTLVLKQNSEPMKLAVI